jgi:dTDP-4-dehydrorhamnose reductase
MVRILVTGAKGQLGQSLVKTGEKHPGFSLICNDLPDFDITDPIVVNGFLEKHKPDCIVNCAAYTAVDQAETDFDKAMLINGIGPLILATSAKNNNIPLIHISTDFVFAGNQNIPYRESDTPGPVSAYGKTKLAGEEAVLRSGSHSVIIRTSWLYSEYGHNFVRTMLRLGKEKTEISVVIDQLGSPTYAGDLAAGIFTVLDHFRSDPGWPSKPEIFHFSNKGVASWFDLAKEVMHLSGLACQVNPILSENYPQKARRPAYSVMDCSRFEEKFTVEIPPWRESLAECIRNIIDPTN